MSKLRHLQVEIERTLKQVEEGHDLFLQYFRKFQATQPGSQKDKFEREMGKEIKKLQRHRDNIRVWVGSPDVKDKNLLLEAKRKIEQQMEAFKACEKESKTKAYSREGLEASSKLDPAIEELLQMREWVQDTQQKLMDQMNILDSELESLTTKKARDVDAIDHVQGSLDKLRYHYEKLDQLLRKTENEGCTNSEKFQELKEVFECFIAADFNYECEDSFAQVYSDLDILKSAALMGSSGSVEDDSNSVHSDSTVSSKKPAAKKAAPAAELSKRAAAPAAKLEVKTEERQGRETRQPLNVWDTPGLNRCSSAPVHDKQLPDKSPLPEKPQIPEVKPQPAVIQERPAEKPEKQPVENPSLKSLLSKLENEPEPVLIDEQDMEIAQEHIDTSFFYAIRGDDRARPSLIVLNTPFQCHSSFPKCPLFRDAERIRQMDLDTLFFIFYHQPGTYQQYLAARYLQSKNWQYHRKEQTWFQREDPGRAKVPGKGTYFYFDYTASWSQRIRQDFVFEPQHLETVEVMLNDSSELPALADTFEPDVEPFVLCTFRQKLLFTYLPSLRRSIYNPGHEYAFHRAVALQDGTVFITGASGRDNENMRHSCMLYDGKAPLYRQESEMGLSSVTLAAIKQDVYLVGSKGCEKCDLEIKRMSKVPAPLHTHLSCGVCPFNGNVLVVSGISCPVVEMYRTSEHHWVEVATLKEAVYNIACAQVTQTEVLIFGGGVYTTWLLNVETGSVRAGGEIPAKVRDTNITVNLPVLHQGFVYCFLGADSTLARYSIETDSWSVLGQEVTGCCALL